MKKSNEVEAWAPEIRKAVSDSLKDPRPSIVVETKKEAEALAKRWAGEEDGERS